MRALREACAEVAGGAHFVQIEPDAIPAYADSLELPAGPPDATAAPPTTDADTERERRAAFWLTLDAINFGSGWFPTLCKRAGRSGYHTIATGLSERFDQVGPWTAGEQAAISPEEIAHTIGQDPAHELMDLFARSLRDLGAHVAADYDGRF